MKRNITLTVVVMLGLILSKIGYTKPGSAKDVLEIHGMTAIETSRAGLLSCGTGMDTFRTAFKAIDARGIQVEGTVCEGVFSDPYIRVRTYVIKLGGDNGS